MDLNLNTAVTGLADGSESVFSFFELAHHSAVQALCLNRLFYCLNAAGDMGKIESYAFDLGSESLKVKCVDSAGTVFYRFIRELNDSLVMLTEQDGIYFDKKLWFELHRINRMVDPDKLLLTRFYVDNTAITFDFKLTKTVNARRSIWLQTSKGQNIVKVSKDAKEQLPPMIQLAEFNGSDKDEYDYFDIANTDIQPVAADIYSKMIACVIKEVYS